MRRLIVSGVLCAWLGLNPGCSCSNTSNVNNHDVDMTTATDLATSVDLSTVIEDLSAASPDLASPSPSPFPGNNCAVPATLQLTPASQSATLMPGVAYSQSFTVTATYANGSTADVTSSSFFTLSDPTVGSLAANTFNWGGDHGGEITVSATECGVTATTQLSLTMAAQFGTGTVNPTTAAGQFGAAGTMPSPACAGANAPKIVYPPDGALVPPNMNVIEVHFTIGSTSNNLFQISFTNSVTSVNVYTQCISATDPSQGMTVAATASNPKGCIFELSQAEWDYIAHTNRNGDPITIGVSALGCDPANAAASVTRQISFAEEDLIGALYYWASAPTSGSATNDSGGIFSYDFGVRGQSPTAVLTPTVNGGGNCIGCHTVSRDGRKLIFAYDDNNNDDEYSDVGTNVFDIPSATMVSPLSSNHTPTFSPGYSTWNHETSVFLLTDGQGQGWPKGTGTQTPAGFLTALKADTTFLAASEPTPNPTPSPNPIMRATTPDFAPDDGHVVFAAPPNQLVSNPPGPSPSPASPCTKAPTPANAAGWWPVNNIDGMDLWFGGASLYTSPWDATTNHVGAPTLLIPATGTQNYYYPSYSPDGSLIAFNYASFGANFNNPLARVQLVASGQPLPTPDDLTKLNGSGNLTNSWPRWSPFVQAYKSGKILWLTFSSTRDYGLRLANSGKSNCYPSESPPGCNTPNNYPTFSPTSTTCTRPQIWMAAVKLDSNGVKTGSDVSFPAFYLPFQLLTSNNHLAQWAQQQFSGTCTTDASCNGGSVTGRCCFSGACAACLTAPSPAPSCTQDANCSPGQCCQSGSCAPCATDGGMSTTPGCDTCLDCNGQACINGACGGCTDNSQCCAPLICVGGACVNGVS